MVLFILKRRGKGGKKVVFIFRCSKKWFKRVCFIGEDVPPTLIFFAKGASSWFIQQK